MKRKYFEQKKKYTCGPACARMMLDTLGIQAEENYLCEILEFIDGHGTRTDSWKNLESVFDIEVKTGNCEFLCDLEVLSKEGWELSLLVFDGLPHYVRYTGMTEYKVLYWNPYFFQDGGMEKNAFIERWKIDTDNYFEIGVINESRLVLDKWYVGIRKRK